MLALTLTRNDHFVGIFRAFRSSSDLTIFDGVTSFFEEAKSSSFCSFDFFFEGHFGGVDGVAFNVNRESDLIIVIGGLRSSPRSVGDWVVDDGGSFTVVGVDCNVAVDSVDGRNGFAESLRGIGSGFATNVDGVSVDTNVAVAQVVNFAQGDNITDEFAVAVIAHNFFEAGAGTGEFTGVCVTSLES